MQKVAVQDETERKNNNNKRKKNKDISNIKLTSSTKEKKNIKSEKVMREGIILDFFGHIR